MQRTSQCGRSEIDAVQSHRSSVTRDRSPQDHTLIAAVHQSWEDQPGSYSALRRSIASTACSTPLADSDRMAPFGARLLHFRGANDEEEFATRSGACVGLHPSITSSSGGQMSPEAVTPDEKESLELPSTCTDLSPSPAPSW